jgi:hypothetical protein
LARQSRADGFDRRLADEGAELGDEGLDALLDLLFDAVGIHDRIL